MAALYGALESAPSNEQSVVTPAGATNTNTISWTAAPAYGAQAVTGYKIYRGTASGQENVYFTAGAAATSFTDTGTAPAAGASTPSLNPATLQNGKDGTVLQPNDGNFEMHC